VKKGETLDKQWNIFSSKNYFESWDTLTFVYPWKNF